MLQSTLLLAFLLLNLNLTAQNFDAQNFISLHARTYYINLKEKANVFEEYSKIENEKKFRTVYICTGRSAYAFHSYSSCPGLNNCMGSIVSIDENSATSPYSIYRQRIHCCRCWSGVSRCVEDNSTQNGRSGSGGGGGASAAYIYLGIAAAIIITGVVLISNDVHIAPAISYYQPNINGQALCSSDFGIGGIFQLRKRFKNSALEYGVSLFRHENINGTYKGVYHQFGAQISYVHNIFPNKMPHPKFNIYIGPIIKWVNTFGAGGIFGATYKIADWLHADFRYEVTNQSNQFSLGLIFTYQKRYFWLKRNRSKK